MDAYSLEFSLIQRSKKQFCLRDRTYGKVLLPDNLKFLKDIRTIFIELNKNIGVAENHTE